MASEPLSEERSDAAKVSETPYPTNGSGKNPGKGGFCFSTVVNTCLSFLNEVKNPGRDCKI